MMEFFKHILGVCGEPHGLLYLIITGGVFILMAPVEMVKEIWRKII